MEILKELQDLCKKAILEISEKQMLLGSVKAEYDNLVSKKAKLEEDAQAAFEELKNVNVKVREERAREIQIIDDKHTDAGVIKAQAEAELQKAKAIGVDLQNKLDAAAVSKQASDDLLAQLKLKEDMLEQRLAKLEEMKAAI